MKFSLKNICLRFDYKVRDDQKKKLLNDIFGKLKTVVKLKTNRKLFTVRKKNQNLISLPHVCIINYTFENQNPYNQIKSDFKS